MRVKTDAKRQTILDVATQAFQELGFEGTSMSVICSRVGGSKATIYNYFSSKEALFFEVMFDLTEKEFDAVIHLLDRTSLNVCESLLRFGKGFLKLLYAPDVLAARRLMIAESGRSDLGRQCFERGPKKAEDSIAAFLGCAMETGALREANPRVAARHLLGLLESEIFEVFILRMQEKITGKEIAAVTGRAVDVFMAAYGPQVSVIGVTKR